MERVPDLLHRRGSAHPRIAAWQFGLSINTHSDIILVTHYPIDAGFRVLDPFVVNDSFDMVTTLYPGRPVYFAEIGYPSGATCGSSEALQEAFVREVFKAWKNTAGKSIWSISTG